MKNSKKVKKKITKSEFEYIMSVKAMVDCFDAMKQGGFVMGLGLHPSGEIDITFHPQLRQIMPQEMIDDCTHIGQVFAKDLKVYLEKLEAKTRKEYESLFSYEHKLGVEAPKNKVKETIF